uniref:RNase H type-1 domain-containing protein n=1 Tax=Cannabis sativa TaxID=3483 RepID=A0A803QN65_CANSA
MIEQSLKLGFRATNNDAEYEALIHGIKLLKEMGAERVLVQSDSQLIVQQAKGDFEAKELKMARYLSEVKKLIATLDYFQISQIPRETNMHADALAGLGSSSPLHITRTIPFDFIPEPSISA